MPDPLPQKLIFLIKLIQLLLQLSQQIAISLLLKHHKFLQKLTMLNLGLVNFLHGLIISFLPGPLPLAKLNLIGKGDRELMFLEGVVMVDGADVLKKVVEMVVVFLMTKHDI